jgi:hypothetical protein
MAKAADLDDLLSRLKEMEELLRFASVAGHLARAEALAISIARNAPNGRTADLAMQALSEMNRLRRPGNAGLLQNQGAIDQVLQRVRLALQEARKDAEAEGGLE